MPYLSEEKLNKLRTELSNRYGNLADLLRPLNLIDKYDGAGKGRYWPNPELIKRTDGSKMEIDLAISDFETILKELKKLKG